MSNWLDVCAVEDLEPDSGVCALLGGKQVALFYLTRVNAIYAVANFDPIGKANVLSRGLIGDLGGEPMVASPLYKQHYNLKTGVCFEYDDIRIASYPVRIDNGRVAVDMEGA